MVKDRIKAFCKSQNITVISFEESIGVSNGYVNAISKSVGIDKINAIVEKFSNLNIEWLLTGKGDMLKNETTRPVQNTSCAVISDGKDARKISKTQSAQLGYLSLAKSLTKMQTKA